MLVMDFLVKTSAFKGIKIKVVFFFLNTSCVCEVE